jgi:hypothetical protein
MKEPERQALLAEMDSLMRSLRKCDTQATAVQWMTRAYKAMDGATQAIAALERMVREEASEQRGLIFHLPKPKIEVVQSIPQGAVMAHRAEPTKPATYTRPSGETVVYPDFFLPPGLKPLPKAWTRDDTRRLAAERFSRRERQIVKRGR